MPLLFKEAVLGYSSELELPVIALAAGLSGAWLVVVASDWGRSEQVLACFGELGAIRLDFPELYSVKPKPLGKGSNAAVFSVLENMSGGSRDLRRLVGKVPFRVPSAAGNEIPKDVRQEVSMLSLLQGHPNIVKFHGLFHTDIDVDVKGAASASWLMLMERCDGGDLFDACVNTQFTEMHAREIVAGLLSALVHVHGCEIVHRDVKPENMLLTCKGRRPVLADFGIACHIRDFNEMQRRCGSPGYAAPEMLSERPYGAKVDCFSTGSLLFFIICNKVPFDGPNLASMLRRTERCNVNFGTNPRWASVGTECKDFVLALLQKDPSRRLTAEGALKHEWFSVEDTQDPLDFQPVSSAKTTVEMRHPLTPGTRTECASGSSSRSTSRSTSRRVMKSREKMEKSGKADRAISNLPSMMSTGSSSSSFAHCDSSANVDSSIRRQASFQGAGMDFGNEETRDLLPVVRLRSEPVAPAPRRGVSAGAKPRGVGGYVRRSIQRLLSSRPRRGNSKSGDGMESTAFYESSNSCEETPGDEGDRSVGLTSFDDRAVDGAERSKQSTCSSPSSSSVESLGFKCCLSGSSGSTAASIKVLDTVPEERNSRRFVQDEALDSLKFAVPIVPQTAPPPSRRPRGRALFS